MALFLGVSSAKRCCTGPASALQRCRRHWNNIALECRSVGQPIEQPVNLWQQLRSIRGLNTKALACCMFKFLEIVYLDFATISYPNL